MNKPNYLELLESIIVESCDKAEWLLSFHEVNSEALRQITLDLELSPLLDKQMLAMGLRLALEFGLTGGISQIALERFRSPASGIAINVQQRAIEGEVYGKGLPMELASDYADKLREQIDVGVDQLPDMLWSYAGLYDEIWRDPRIYARTPTRRIMLAMVTVLRARSAQLTMTRNRASTATVNQPERRDSRRGVRV